MGSSSVEVCTYIRNVHWVLVTFVLSVSCSRSAMGFGWKADMMFTIALDLLESLILIFAFAPSLTFRLSPPWLWQASAAYEMMLELTLRVRICLANWRVSAGRRGCTVSVSSPHLTRQITRRYLKLHDVAAAMWRKFPWLRNEIMSWFAQLNRHPRSREFPYHILELAPSTTPTGDGSNSNREVVSAAHSESSLYLPIDSIAYSQSTTKLLARLDGPHRQPCSEQRPRGHTTS